MLEINDLGYRLCRVYHTYIEAFMINLRLYMPKDINVISRHEYQSLKRPDYELERLAKKHAIMFVATNIDLIKELKGSTAHISFAVNQDKLKVVVEGVNR